MKTSAAHLYQTALECSVRSFQAAKKNQKMCISYFSFVERISTEFFPSISLSGTVAITFQVV